MDIPKKVIEQLEKDLKNVKTYEDLMGKDGAIKKLIKHSLEKLLNAELTDHLGYVKHSQDDKPDNNRRNGKSDKTMKSELGKIELEMPRDRNGSFKPIIVKKHQRNLGQLQDAIISMYAKGMSTRDIQTHIENIYGVELSPSTISMITETVLDMIHQWQDRTLEQIYTVVYFDAIHYKVREEGKVVTKAAYTALGIDLEGERDLLGLWIGEAEGAHFWLGVLSELKQRGVKDILIACVDGLKGFPDAIASTFPKTEIQLCIIHQIRNTLRYISWKDSREILKDLKTIYEAVSEDSALIALEQFENKWSGKYAVAVRSWRNNWGNLSTYFRFPIEIRKMIYTTNAVEALHRQFRKVTKSKAIFPTDDALIKMLFLAYNDLKIKWNKPVNNWGLILSQLSIIFSERISMAN
jgi:transposase-like protein